MDVTDNQIRKIKKEYRRKKIFTFLIGGLSSILSYLIGHLAGKYREPRMEHRGYPYGWSSMFFCSIGASVILAGGGWVALMSHLERKNKYDLAFNLIVMSFIIVAVLSLLFGYHQGQPVEYYSEAVKYGVYTKKE